ncbi:MAG: CPXCG motif-containing cysteine-rich protein [Gammaproteobacteria bacterium]
MSNVLNSSTIECPYCGENIEVLIDSSTGNQHYIEDCQVCCSPIEISVEIDFNGQILNIQAKRDAD